MTARDDALRALAERLCSGICDLLGEPRVLVPGEVLALLQRANIDAVLDTTAETTGEGEFRAAVQQVYDLQCPPRRSSFADDDYGKGAWTAHRWWSTVLGGVLSRYPAPAGERILGDRGVGGGA